MKLLKPAEVASVLRVPRTRVYDLIRQKLLPACRMGRQVRVEEETLRQWIADGGTALPGGWRRSDPVEEGPMNGEPR